MVDSPTAARRARARRRAMVLLLALGGGIALLVAAQGPAHLVEAIIRGGLGRAGVTVTRLEIHSVGFGHVEFGPLQLGGADGPAIATLTATWSPQTLLQHRLGSLRITGMRLKANVTATGVTIVGLPSLAPATSTATTTPVAILPCDRVDLDDAEVILALPAGTAQIHLGAHVTRATDATMQGSARITALVTIGTAPPLTLQAELPRWTLAAPDQPLRLDVVDGKLTSPGLRGGLGTITARLTATANRIDVAASAAGADDMTGTLALAANLARGNKPPASGLTLILKGLGIPGDLASASGIDGRLQLAALTPPRTATPQSLTGTLQIPPLAPGRFALTAGLPGDGSLRLAAARLELAAGTLSLPPLTIAARQPLATVLGLDGIDLGVVLPLLGIDGLGGTGMLDGHIPVRVDPAGVAISGGHLVARGPGVLHYTGSALPDAGPGSAATTVSLLRQALADFHYTGLTLDLDRAASGQGSLMIGLKGANPAVLNAYPFALNIRVDADFDRLVGLLRSGYDTAGGMLRRGIGR